MWALTACLISTSPFLTLVRGACPQSVHTYTEPSPLERAQREARLRKRAAMGRGMRLTGREREVDEEQLHDVAEWADSTEEGAGSAGQGPHTVVVVVVVMALRRVVHTAGACMLH